MKTERKKTQSGSTRRSKTFYSLVAIGLAISFIATFYGGVVVEANTAQRQYYQQVIQAWQNQEINFTATATQSSSGYDANLHLPLVQFAVAIFHAHDFSPRENLINQGFIANCVTLCINGISYFKDPTTIITNQGRGVEQCLIFNVATTDTCTASNFPLVEGWSYLRGGQTVNATDTWASTHSSCTTNEGTAAYKLITDANGLADAAGTATAGANGATVTTSITKTFSITGTYTAVQVACLNSALHGGTNPLIYAESTFGPDTFANGDSLTGTWQISRT